MSAASKTNPFICPPTPEPYNPSEEGASVLAWEVFAPEVVARVLRNNMDWLQFRPRSTQQVREALFPWFTRAGMPNPEILLCLGFALWEAGYQYSSEGPNQTWAWREAD